MTVNLSLTERGRGGTGEVEVGGLNLDGLFLLTQANLCNYGRLNTQELVRHGVQKMHAAESKAFTGTLFCPSGCCTKIQIDLRKKIKVWEAKQGLFFG